MGSDLDLYDVAQKVPGFAGVYRDVQHIPHIRLVDPSQATVARSAIAELLRGHGDAFAAVPGVVESATFSALDLLRWRVKARELFGDPGLVGVGIDVIANRVTIGLVAEGARDGIRSKAAALGIPLAAADLVVMGPPVPSVKLQDQVRPMTGGVKLTFQSPDSVGGGSSDTYCSRGPTVHRIGVRGFLTASHCSGHFAQYTGTTYKQGSSTVIGQESVDPAALPAGGICAWALPCRRSDALFVADVGSPSVGFDIAVTTTVGVGSAVSGDSTLSYRDPVVGSGIAVAGDYLYKTGFRTGTTYGMVTNTCFDFQNVRYDWLDHYSLPCQGIIAAGVQAGDSGSPVWLEAANNDATVYGILWGQSCSLIPAVACNYFYYSSWLSASKEIGSLTLF